MAPLIAHPRRDSPGSFEAVYRKHVRDVYGFSLSLLGNAEDAEDVTQTTFLNAYRALQRGENVRNLRAWLLAIAHNVCRQRFRTAARRPQEVELDPEAAEAFVDEDAPSAEEIRNAMAQLSFNQRTVLVLREIEGLTYEEIAQAMGLSLSAVETLLFRARRAVREQLEAADHDLGCDSVQRLISLQLDGKLSRHDRGLLRAHLRTCAECARFARSQRARKRVMPSLIAVPLPAGLTGAFEAGGAGVLTSKVAAVAVSAVLIGAGALVETGVVPKPGTSSGDVVANATTANSPRPARLDELLRSPFASRVLTRVRADVRAAAGEPAKARPKGARGGRAGKAGKDAPASNVPASNAGAGTGATSGTSSGGGSSGSGGSGGGGLGGVAGGVPAVSPPSAPSVNGAVQQAAGSVQDAGGAVGGAVGGAQSNLPALPGSLPVEAPSLPPVAVPGPGSLP